MFDHDTYVGRIYSNGSVDYCSKFFKSRAEAAEACFKARPNASRCMTSEARYNENLKATVPTHDGIEWISRPLPAVSYSIGDAVPARS